MSRAEQLTEEQWAVIEPLLPKAERQDGRGRPRVDNRAVFNGIFWILRTGAAWADLPDRFPSYQTAGAYGACQILLEAVRRAGSLDGDKVRDALAKYEANTAFGAYRVDPTGFQLAHKMIMFQWQDGKKVIVWPEELAAERPRFPTPQWNKRK